MHLFEVNAKLPGHEEAMAARRAGGAWLATALVASRRDTLSTFEVFEQRLESLAVPQRESLNPPVWELGHIGWFQEFWLARNPERHLGARADPEVPRLAGVRARCDELYNSSTVPHATRWTLPLPAAADTRADLEHQLGSTLALLRETGDGDAALYFFRLALLHEDMHHEAALYMAQSLGVPIDDPRWQATPLPEACPQLAFDTSLLTLGSAGAGFAFDNELSAHPTEVAACEIDSRVLRWAEYLPFVEAGGYGQPQWWSDAGGGWMARERPTAPRYTRRRGSGWQQWRHGEWRDLDMDLPACHLTAFEAEAWCRWAGRRLPTEAEWERAAIECPDEFDWGQVWEWTASPFLPYRAFEPHPYRDYSVPWFGDRPVLRGASFMTQPRMRHPRYRNFFMAWRNDVPAGFRSCRR